MMSQLQIVSLSLTAGGRTTGHSGATGTTVGQSVKQMQVIQGRRGNKIYTIYSTMTLRTRKVKLNANENITGYKHFPPN